MSKRSASVEGLENCEDRFVQSKTVSQTHPSASIKDTDINMEDEMGEFDDACNDYFGSDGEIIEVDDEDEDEDEAGAEDQDLDMGYLERKQQKAQELVRRDFKETEEQTQKLYLPHLSRPLGTDEFLEADPTVYEMLHNITLPWPCMTLEVIPDKLGFERRDYPQSVLIATATQAFKKKDNELLVLKISQLTKTLVKNDEDEDEDEDDDDEDDDEVDPIIESEHIPLRETTNRMKISPLSADSHEVLTATMSESGDVYIYNLASHTKAFNTPGYTIPKVAQRPLHTIKYHGNVEGYSLDWSPLVKSSSLLTGDCSGRIYLTQRTSSKWLTDKQPFTVENNKSIEDIQWSRGENTVFASCGVDGHIRIWDIRSKKHMPALNVRVSNTDVNVMSWNENFSYLLASGDDDGSWGVWDLRNFSSQTNEALASPVAKYNFHKGPITSISFNPVDDSVVAVASEDNTVTLWDLSVEADDEEITQQAVGTPELRQIPPQLLFVHWQKEVKDVKWHRQIPGCLVSTGTDGLNIWKTISV